jgi:hypothetical protein
MLGSSLQYISRSEIAMHIRPERFKAVTITASVRAKRPAVCTVTTVKSASLRLLRRPVLNRNAAGLSQMALTNIIVSGLSPSSGRLMCQNPASGLCRLAHIHG